MIVLSSNHRVYATESMNDLPSWINVTRITKNFFIYTQAGHWEHPRSVSIYEPEPLTEIYIDVNGENLLMCEVPPEHKFLTTDNEAIAVKDLDVTHSIQTFTISHNKLYCVDVTGIYITNNKTETVHIDISSPIAVSYPKGFAYWASE